MRDLDLVLPSIMVVLLMQLLSARSTPSGAVSSSRNLNA